MEAIDWPLDFSNWIRIVTMKLDDAFKLLFKRGWINPARELEFIYLGKVFVFWKSKYGDCINKRVSLDGAFDIEELDAMVTWVRATQEERDTFKLDC